MDDVYASRRDAGHSGSVVTKLTFHPKASSSAASLKRSIEARPAGVSEP